MQPTTIYDYIKSVAGSFPMRATILHMDLEKFDELLSLIPNESNRRLIESLAWLRLGKIDRPHQIVQDASGGVEAYIHGIIHRMEGDYWNSKYWFRRADVPSLNDSISKRLASDLSVDETMSLGPAFSKQIFSPPKFVDLVESSQAKSAKELTDSRLAFISQVAEIEWESLWRTIQS